MRSNQLELPRIEQNLIARSGKLLSHKNQEGLTPLLLSLKRGSECKSDPINVVKLMLDSPSAGKIIEMRDDLGNLPLHYAAKSSSVPLALSIVFAKTPVALRNSANDLGNTPLSEALLQDETSNALFILQTCNDPI